MSYAADLASVARAPVIYAVITLDYCARTFGAAPCAATGDKCYNTYPTCKDKTHYSRTTKDYALSSCDAPLPFKTGERPYIKGVKYLPTEIKIKENLTVSSRVILECYDEEDTDVGIDPYVADRATVQGTYWKKLLARNANYKGRAVKIYEGFIPWVKPAPAVVWESGIAWESGVGWPLDDTAALALTDLQQMAVGIIDNATLLKGVVRIEIADLLKVLSRIEVPSKLDIKLVNDITDVQTSITLTDASGLDATGYVRIDDEIVYYGVKSDVTNVISTCTRGSFSTTAAAHDANAKVQKCRYYAAANPFDILEDEMLTTDAGIAAGYIDAASFTYWKGWPGGEINFSAIVSEPTALDKLYFEILDLIDCKSWVGEDLKITIRRNVPNEPSRSYSTVTDQQNIVRDSCGVDLNDASRISRMSVYWDRTAVGDADEVASYGRLDIAIDADAEGVNEYNEAVEKKIMTRWIQAGLATEETLANYMENITTRRVSQRRDAMPVLALELEQKDSGIKTGAYVKVTTDEIQDKDGNDLSAQPFQVIRREQKGNKISVKLLRQPARRICFIAPAATAAYTSATAAEKEYGFICGADKKMSNGDEGYYPW